MNSVWFQSFASINFPRIFLFPSFHFRRIIFQKNENIRKHWNKNYHNKANNSCVKYSENSKKFLEEVSDFISEGIHSLLSLYCRVAPKFFFKKITHIALRCNNYFAFSARKAHFNHFSMNLYFYIVLFKISLFKYNFQPF